VATRHPCQNWCRLCSLHLVILSIALIQAILLLLAVLWRQAALWQVVILWHQAILMVGQRLEVAGLLRIQLVTVQCLLSKMIDRL